MSQHEVHQVEDETANLTSRRTFLRTGLVPGAGALSAGSLVNGVLSDVAAGVGVDMLRRQVGDGG